MNSRKAKQLRKQAKEIAVENELETLVYSQKSYRKVTVDVTGKYIPYMVYTQSMEDCERNVYKQLKKESR